MPPTGILITGAALAVAMIGLWLTYRRDRNADNVRRTEFESKVLAVKAERDSKVDLRLERLDTKMETVWSAFTAQLLTVLHHPDPAKIIPDALLKKYEASITIPSAITTEELIELVGYMTAVVKNESLVIDERKSAEQLLRLIRHHRLWQPTPEAAASLEKIIGPDLHPRPIDPAEPLVETVDRTVDKVEALNVAILNVDVLNVTEKKP